MPALYEDILSCLQNMLSDAPENIGIVDTVIVQWVFRSNLVLQIQNIYSLQFER